MYSIEDFLDLANAEQTDGKPARHPQSSGPVQPGNSGRVLVDDRSPSIIGDDVGESVMPATGLEGLPETVRIP